MQFSVIVPLYNCEKFISDCLISLVNQTISDDLYEIIVVNDGSTDNGEEKVKEFKNKYNNIKLLSKENGGLSDARNVGLDNASGKYIIFIDADDYVETTLLEEVNKIINNQDFIIFGYYTDTYENDKLISSIIENFSNNTLDESINNMNILKFSNLVGFAWNKVYRKNFLDENNIRFEKGTSLIEDILFNSKVIKNSSNYNLIRIPLVHYIQRKNRKTLSKCKYKNLDELLIRSFVHRITIFERYYSKDLLRKKTELFEFMLKYFLSNDSNNLFVRTRKIKKFYNATKQYVNIDLIHNKILKLMLNFKLYFLLVLMYQIKGKIRK